MAPNAVNSDICESGIYSSGFMSFNHMGESNMKNNISNPHAQRHRYNSSSPLGKHQFSENVRHRTTTPVQMCRMPRDNPKYVCRPQSFTEVMKQAFTYSQYQRNNKRKSPIPNFHNTQQISSVRQQRYQPTVRRHHSLSESTPAPSSKFSQNSNKPITAMTCAELEASVPSIKKIEESNENLNKTAPLTCAEIENLQRQNGSTKFPGVVLDHSEDLIISSNDSLNDSGFVSVSSVTSEDLHDVSFSSNYTECILEDTIASNDISTVSSTPEPKETLFDSILSPITSTDSLFGLQMSLKSTKSIQPVVKESGNQESKMKKDLLPLFNETQDIGIHDLNIHKLNINQNFPQTPSQMSGSLPQLKQSSPSLVNKNHNGNNDGIISGIKALEEKCINSNKIPTTIVYNSTMSDHNNNNTSIKNTNAEDSAVAMPLGAAVSAPSSVTLPSPPNAWRRSVSPSNDITHHFAQLMNGGSDRHCAAAVVRVH